MSLSDHQNIALFGGTFDPVHIGHLEVARYVLDHCNLASVLFIPAPFPPHKKSPHASFYHRVEMLKIALLDEPGMQISLIENEYSGPSYTVKTVRALQQRHKKNRFFLIIGADSLIDIPLWYNCDELLNSVNLIVVGREDQVKKNRIQETINAFSVSYSYDEHKGIYCSKHNQTITILDNFKWLGSSSAIRKKLQQGVRPKELAAGVYSYITNHKLYSNDL